MGASILSHGTSLYVASPHAVPVCSDRIVGRAITRAGFISASLRHHAKGLNAINVTWLYINEGIDFNGAIPITSVTATGIFNFKAYFPIAGHPPRRKVFPAFRGRRVFSIRQLMRWRRAVTARGATNREFHGELHHEDVRSFTRH